MSDAQVNYRRRAVLGLAHAVLMLAAALQAAESQRGVARWAGRPIPGAVVTATQGDRKFVTSTDESGAYQFDGLDPGEWKIKIAMFGFQDAERIVTIPGQSGPIEWTLELRARSPQAGQAQTGRAGYQALVQNRQVEGQVQAAIDSSNAGPQPAPAAGSNANEAFLINGSLSQGLQRTDSSEVSMSYGWGDTAGASRALFGAGSAQSATSIHGALVWTLKDSDLDARPYSLSGQTVAKPAYSQNRYSAMAGGALPKSLRLAGSFFLNYALTRGSSAFQGFATVPTAVERTGDFSGSLPQGPSAIYDPSSAQPFPGNRLPASRISPAAAGLNAFTPLPNQPGMVDNYQLVTSVPQNSHYGRASLNLRLTSKDRLDFMQTVTNTSSEQSQVFGYKDAQSGYDSRTTIGWTHRSSATLSQGLRFDFHRGRNETVPYFANKTDVAASLGIQGTSQNPIDYGPPNLSFTNFSGLTDSSPVVRRDQGAVIGYGMYWSRGKHGLGSGFEYYRNQLNNRTDENGRGSLTFTGLETSGFDQNGLPLPGTGFDLADFLLGLPQTSSVRFGASNNYFRSTNYATYLTDDWRVTSNLTFVLGLRYEYYGPYSEKYGSMANLDIAPGFTDVAVVTAGGSGPYTGRFPAALINPDRKGFAPRLGLAWSPFPKHSFNVRASYGVYYNGGVYAQTALLLASQPPFANAGVLDASLAVPLRIEDSFVTVAQQGSALVTNTYAVNRNYQVGYAQIWTTAVTQELPHALTVEVGYLGTKGTHLDLQRLPNRAAPGSPLTSEDRRQIAGAVGFIYDSSEGNSILHAGQLRVVRRFQKGMSFNALYTYSKSIDNASTFGSGVVVVAQDDMNLRAERGLSSFDQRQALNTFFMVNSPVGGQGAPIQTARWLGRIVKNWVFLGGITASSGMPLTARVLGNLSDPGGTGAVGDGRADATGAPIGSSSGFFNPAAFTIPLSTGYGSAGRNTIPTPSRLTMNLAAGRTFRVNDRYNLEFRADSVNLLNSVTITGFGTTVNASNYGVASAVAPMRSLSISLRLRF